jgi:L-ribulose-5-phosphate 3-epimerase
MIDHASRREFLQRSAQLSAGLVLGAGAVSSAEDKKPKAASKQLYKISCTEYSFHRMMGKKELDNLDFAAYVKKNFAIDAVDYWNSPFKTKAKDAKYIAEMRKRADDVGVKGTCILIDGEGNLGDPDEKKRLSAVDRHKKWVMAAKTLGCASIRVNARSGGTYDEQQRLAADGLRRLCEFAGPLKMAVIVENHGGLSSNGKWLVGVMKKVGLKNCGTLPDFGNFGKYDRYQGTKEMMPYAKLVSAKSHDFDGKGNETGTDYFKMMKIVVDSGYRGYAGIEYEGRRLSEPAGVRATKRLLLRVHEHLLHTT